MEYALSHLEGIRESLNNISNNVLTKREQFIKDAPPVPDWFTNGVLEPVRPLAWDQIKWPNEEAKSKAQLWQSERNFDLVDDGVGKQYQAEWERYDLEVDRLRQRSAAENFFAWRIYYADMMLQEIEKSNQKPE